MFGLIIPLCNTDSWSTWTLYRLANKERKLFGRCEKTSNGWNGSWRADYSTPTFDLQGHYLTYQLIHNGASTLAAKFGSGSDITYTMTYEKDHQLKTWDSSRTGGTDSSYAWDSAGNPTNYYGQGFTPNGLNQIEPTGGYSPDYVYGADGNLTQDKKRWKTYTYDGNNRLIKATFTLTQSYYSEFKYDYMGRRVEKKVVAGPGNATTTRYVYQGMELIAEIETEIVYDVVIGGNPLKTFHWGMDKSSTRGGAGGAMGLVMMRIHSGTHTGSYFPAYDLNGNVTGMMNSSGTLVAWYEYDGFGKKVTDGGVSGFEDVNPIQFSTQFFDQDTGLINYGFRYYDPSQGRFLNRDPIGERGGANLYRFVNNDPVHNVDKWGLKTCQYLEMWPEYDARDVSEDGYVSWDKIRWVSRIVTMDCPEDIDTGGFDTGTGGDGGDGGDGGVGGTGDGTTNEEKYPQLYKDCAQWAKDIRQFKANNLSSGMELFHLELHLGALQAGTSGETFDVRKASEATSQAMLFIDEVGSGLNIFSDSASTFLKTHGWAGIAMNFVTIANVEGAREAALYALNQGLPEAGSFLLNRAVKRIGTPGAQNLGFAGNFALGGLAFYDLGIAGIDFYEHKRSQIWETNGRIGEVQRSFENSADLIRQYEARFDEYNCAEILGK